MEGERRGGEERRKEREGPTFSLVYATPLVINTILGRLTPDILPVCIVLDGTMLLFLVILCFSYLATWLPFLNKPIDWLID